MDLKRLLNEPSLIAGAIRAIILVGTAFGLHWSADQIAAVMLAVEAVLTLLVRSVVTPNHIAEERVDRGGRPSVSLAEQGIESDAPVVNPRPDEPKATDTKLDPPPRIRGSFPSFPQDKDR
jgi:hypothetical protein